MASLSTKVLELACFLGASETKDQAAISSVAANKDGELFCNWSLQDLEGTLLATLLWSEDKLLVTN